MIARTFDATFLNGVINHPEVRPWIKGDGLIDITELALDPANYILQSEFGGFILLQHELGIYQVHSQFLPGHGTHPAKAMQAAQNWMFTRTDCREIVSVVPNDNKAAKGFALIGGLRPIFTREGSEYVGLDLMSWAMRTKALLAEGQRLHAFFDAASSGLGWPEHADDPAHEHAAGAALLMIERGQAIKGVEFYNRWARLAGYPVITLHSISPVVVDMSAGPATCVMGLGSSGMEMLLCR